MFQELLQPGFEKNLLDLAPVIIAIHDKEHNIVWANKAYKQATALTQSNIDQKKCYAAWGLAKPCRNCPVARAITTGEQHEAELSPENQEHWPASHGTWLLKAVPIEDADGNIIGAMTTGHSTTKFKQTETKLKKLNSALEVRVQQHTADLIKSEEVLRVAFGLSPLGKALVAPDGRFLKVNTALCRILGYSEEELLQRTFQSITHSDDLAADLAHVKQLLAGKIDAYEMEKRYLQKQNKLVWAQLNVTLIRNDNGTPRFFIAQIQDITRRKEAENALHLSETRFCTLADQLNDVVWTATADGSKILGVNQTTEKVYGISQEQFIANPALWLTMAHSEDRGLAEESYSMLLKSGQTQTEYRIVRPDGDIRWIRDRKTIIHDETGQPVQMGGIVTDFTEDKKKEIEAEKLRAKFVQAQKMETVGRLASGVAHDCNNALSVIIGCAEMALLQTPEDSPVNEDLQEILAAAKCSTQITRQLLGFARRQIIAPRTINLNQAIENMLKMLQRLLGENLGLAWIPGNDIWLINIDPTQLDQILTNLCVNAKDAITDIGKVTIETRNFEFDEVYCNDHVGYISGKYVMLAVSDNGHGMNEETISQIYEPFFTTKKAGHGTGLGLATVYGIVQQNAGFINVYSETEKGTTFRLYLPRFAGEAEIEVKTDDAAPLRGQGETILVVEDDISILKMIRLLLERLDYRVLAAGSPNEAMRLVKEHSSEIHLLITDVIMPEMNGKILSNQLQELRPDLKCLYMSGYTANIIAQQGILDEGVNFLQKPIYRKDLAAKIRAILEATPTTSKANLDETISEK